jgi:hypothetical protein
MSDELKTQHTVFGDVVEIITTDDYRTGHFCRYNFAGQYTSTNRDVTSEWTFFVYVRAQPKSRAHRNTGTNNSPI